MTLPTQRRTQRRASSRRLQHISIALGLFGVIFVGAGYFWSDARFFKNLVRQHHIATPDDTWNWLGRRTFAARPGQAAIPGLSARYMLTQQKSLYCDEGALLMATLLREIGYESRLVDLYGVDGVSHHTVLEVETNGRWQTYDTLLRLRHASLEASARGCRFRLVTPLRRPSWSLYRSAVYYNVFIKYFAFKWRGIPG